MKLKQNLFALPMLLVIAVSVFPIGARALTYQEIMQAQTGKVLADSTIYPFATGSLVNDHGTIYYIYGTDKIPFTNYSAFIGLGYSLKNVINGDTSDYRTATSFFLSTAQMAHPWGQWLLYKGTVYYSSSNGLIPVTSAQIFLNNGGVWQSLVNANGYDVAILNANDNLPFLTNSDPRVSNASGLGLGNNSGITITSPSGGEQWRFGTTQTISWTAPGGVSNVNISLARPVTMGVSCSVPVNGGLANCPDSGWLPIGWIVKNVQNSGSYSWQIGHLSLDALSGSGMTGTASSSALTTGSSGSAQSSSGTASGSSNSGWPYPTSSTTPCTANSPCLSPNLGGLYPTDPGFTIAPAGQYAVIVSDAGASGLTTTSNEFAIIAAPTTNSAPTISSLNPANGSVATQITITGSFTSSGNTIVANGMLWAGNLSSADGATLQFTVPSSAGAYCTTGMCPDIAMLITAGNYPLTVINANGTSNSQTFTVTDSNP